MADTISRAIQQPVPDSFEQSLLHYTYKKADHVPNVLLGDMGPRRKIDKSKQAHVPSYMPADEYAKRLKMMSLSPSVYGNIYGVLGNS